MMTENLKKYFCEITDSQNVKEQEPMARHTTFRVGGPARFYICPETPEEAAEVIRVCNREGVPWFILGNGSNLLVSDEGYDGVVIQMYRQMGRIEIEGTCIRAQAGALLGQIAAKALAAGLKGFEFAAGIPGTLGGAVTMNAGAYGGEMKQVLAEVTVLDREGKLRVIPAEDLEMGYRTTIIKKENYVVLEALLRLEPGDPQKIRALMDELQEKRSSKQPLSLPSAGSTFKRPEGYFAGKLIMDAGLGGYCVGGACVSEKHCGFIVNQDHATAADIYRLIREVQETVEEKFGVHLEPEVKMLGKF